MTLADAQKSLGRARKNKMECMHFCPVTALMLSSGWLLFYLYRALNAGIKLFYHVLVSVHVSPLSLPTIPFLQWPAHSVRYVHMVFVISLMCVKYESVLYAWSSMRQFPVIRTMVIEQWNSKTNFICANHFHASHLDWLSLPHCPRFLYYYHFPFHCGTSSRISFASYCKFNEITLNL